MKDVRRSVSINGRSVTITLERGTSKTWVQVQDAGTLGLSVLIPRRRLKSFLKSTLAALEKLA